jgi:hypothetical protein
LLISRAAARSRKSTSPRPYSIEVLTGVSADAKSARHNVSDLCPEGFPCRQFSLLI